MVCHLLFLISSWKRNIYWWKASRSPTNKIISGLTCTTFSVDLLAGKCWPSRKQCAGCHWRTPNHILIYWIWCIHFFRWKIMESAKESNLQCTSGQKKQTFRALFCSTQKQLSQVGFISRHALLTIDLLAWIYGLLFFCRKSMSWLDMWTWWFRGMIPSPTHWFPRKCSC